MADPAFTQVSSHLYWLQPSPPDRPSLGAIVGRERTLMLDAGASPAHARHFLERLAATGARPPELVALTHWHWDHVFGAAEIGRPLIAHAETRDRLAELAGYGWSDADLDARVASGVEEASCARDIKLELPEPRTVTIAPPTVIFHGTLEVDLGGVTCVIRHVGGDHAADSCVAHLPDDGVVFLGDCLYHALYTPTQRYTSANAFPLLDTLLALDADTFIEGHGDALLSRLQLDEIAGTMREVGSLVERVGGDAEAAYAAAERARGALDDELRYLLDMFLAGWTRPSGGPSDEGAAEAAG
jgi:glyoxylase-like metal-dependent hydrolase (beta-lactamase superfamily II)